MDSREVTFVMQGPVLAVGDRNFTKIGLESVRKHFPHAEIILSTWKGSDVDGFEYDAVLFSEDPKKEYTSKYNPFYLNLVRQIVSTQKGVEKASRKYVVKIRTDTFFKNDNLLKRFKSEPTHKGIFKNKLLVQSVSSHIPEKAGWCFFMSDMVLMGLKEDLYDLFSNKQLATIKKYAESVVKESKESLSKNGLAFEQVLWFSFLQKKYKLNQYVSGISEPFLTAHHDFFSRNIEIYSIKQIGTLMQKYPNLYLYDYFNPSIYTHSEWMRYKLKTLENKKKPRSIIVIIRNCVGMLLKKLPTRSKLVKKVGLL